MTQPTRFAGTLTSLKAALERYQQSQKPASIELKDCALSVADGAYFLHSELRLLLFTGCTFQTIDDSNADRKTALEVFLQRLQESTTLEQLHFRRVVITKRACHELVHLFNKVNGALLQQLWLHDVLMTQHQMNMLGKGISRSKVVLKHLMIGSCDQPPSLVPLLVYFELALANKACEMQLKELVFHLHGEMTDLNYIVGRLLAVEIKAQAPKGKPLIQYLSVPGWQIVTEDGVNNGGARRFQSLLAAIEKHEGLKSLYIGASLADKATNEYLSFAASLYKRLHEVNFQY